MKFKIIIIFLTICLCSGASEVRLIGPAINSTGKNTIYLAYSEGGTDKILVKFKEDEKNTHSLNATYQVAKTLSDVSFEVFDHAGKKLAIFAISSGSPSSKITKVCFVDLDDKDIEGRLKIEWVSAQSNPEIWRKGVTITNEAALILDLESAVNKIRGK